MGKTINMGGKGPPPPPVPQEPQLNIKPEDLTDYTCNNCGNQTFVQAFVFKTLSAVMSPDGKERMIPLQVFKCDECNEIGKEFLPKT